MWIPSLLYHTQLLHHALLIINIFNSISELEVVLDCSFWFLILVINHQFDLFVLIYNTVLYLNTYCIFKTFLKWKPIGRKFINFFFIMQNIKELLQTWYLQRSLRSFIIIIRCDHLMHLIVNIIANPVLLF